MIPPGTYRARVASPDSHQFGYSSNETEQIALTFKFLQEPFAGQYMTWFGFFTDKTKETTFKTLRACGWQGDDLADMSGIDANEVDLVIETELDQQGRERSRIRWVNELGGGKVKMQNTMTPEQQRAFAARMKGTAIALREGKGPAKPPRPSDAKVRQDAAAHGAVDEPPF